MYVLSVIVQPLGRNIYVQNCTFNQTIACRENQEKIADEIRTAFVMTRDRDFMCLKS